MAVLEITCASIDHGAATGNATEVVKVLSHKLDAVYQDVLVLNALEVTSVANAANAYRNHLTANGVTWDSESAVVIL